MIWNMSTRFPGIGIATMLSWCHLSMEYWVLLARIFTNLWIIWTLQIACSLLIRGYNWDDQIHSKLLLSSRDFFFVRLDYKGVINMYLIVIHQ